MKNPDKKTDKYKENILVLDDNEMIRRLVSNVLDKDYEVNVLNNGLQGSCWLHNNENFPDLIITDIFMPEMDGFEFIRNVKGSAYFDEIPVLVLSSHDTLHEEKVCEELGITEFLQKPFNPVELKEKVLELLGKVA